MRNVLLCTVFGDRYWRMFARVRAQLEAYAARCGCDLQLIEKPLDPDNAHSYLTQRLLIADRFSRFDVIAHIDIDILIPRALPDIFQSLPNTAGFSATADPRGTDGYVEAWGKAPFTRWTNKEYFAQKGWDVDDSFVSINGGVLLFRPALVADLFASWYRDPSRFAGHPDTFFQCEEGIFAYLSQKNRLFARLPVHFNMQVHYALHDRTSGRTALAKYRSVANRGLRKTARAFGDRSGSIGYGKSYTRFVEELLKENNLVHFAGNYPIPAVRDDVLIATAEAPDRGLSSFSR
jgi:hypothetical protein